jgi:hypothetical protein
MEGRLTGLNTVPIAYSATNSIFGRLTGLNTVLQTDDLALLVQKYKY